MALKILMRAGRRVCSSPSAYLTRGRGCGPTTSCSSTTTAETAATARSWAPDARIYPLPSCRVAGLLLTARQGAEGPLCALILDLRASGDGEQGERQRSPGPCLHPARPPGEGRQLSAVDLSFCLMQLCLMPVLSLLCLMTGPRGQAIGAGGGAQASEPCRKSPSVQSQTHAAALHARRQPKSIL